MRNMKAFIRMKGNHWEYENGKTYEVDLDTANNLSGMGIAEIVDAPTKEEIAL